MSALSVNDQQWAGKTESASGQREDSRTTKSTLMTWLDSCFLMMQARLIILCVWVIIIRALILSTWLCSGTLWLLLKFQIIHQHFHIFLSLHLIYVLWLQVYLFIYLCLTSAAKEGDIRSYRMIAFIVRLRVGQDGTFLTLM